MTKLLFIGDIHSDTLPPNSWLSPDIKKIFKEHSFVSCNYEGVSTTTHSSVINKVGPRLTQSQELLTTCHQAGINHYNLANNHIMDHGITGLSELIAGIKRLNCSYGGANLNPDHLYTPSSFRSNGIVFDIYSGCEADHGIVTSEEQRPGAAWINDSALDRNILLSKQKKRFVIVQAHGGEETSLPLPEWKARYHSLIDLGADLIVAHHPHVPQGWEEYAGKKIFYSLGNFYFKNSTIPSATHGIMLSVDINKEYIYSTRVIPVSVAKEQVILNESSLSQLEELSRQIVSKDYLLMATSQALVLWNKYYSHYFSNSVYQSRLKPLVKSKYNYPLILHNIKIESHRWTIIRALEQIMRQNAL